MQKFFTFILIFFIGMVVADYCYAPVGLCINDSSGLCVPYHPPVLIQAPASDNDTSAPAVGKPTSEPAGNLPSTEVVVQSPSRIQLYSSMYLILLVLGITTTLVVMRDQKRREAGRRLIKELTENIKKRMK